jgi:hypothetical protein
MMRREASVHAEVGGEAGEVRAILESSELILRGAIRRRFPKPMLERVTVQGDMLRFTCAGERVRLHLGARALLVGSFDDDELARALEGVLVEDGAAAAMLIACIKRPEDLSAARAICAAHEGLPLWTIYPKGRGAAFGDCHRKSASRLIRWRLRCPSS